MHETYGDDKDWWRGAIIYQVYPRSFKDSNGDGIGDLAGISEGLEHIASLEVDAVWLSPFYKSPQKDFGYDIADYQSIDPIFGTLADFDALIAKAHSLGLKIIVDQVYCHTSEEHAWFVESRQNTTNEKADWFVWADPKPDGSPPSNWQSVFGGPAWTWDARRRQYYLHNFLKEQPQLNLHNPDTQDALLATCKFWLDRGVDGIRVDAINFAMHDPDLRDNPPSGCPIEQVTRPFDMQHHVFNQSHPDTPKFLARIRQLLDSYPNRFSVAEIPGPNPLEEMEQYTKPNTGLHTAYGFDFLYAQNLRPETIRRALQPWNATSPTPGSNPTSLAQNHWPSWAFSNHDAPRAVSRWAPPEWRDQAARLYLMLLLGLRGTLFLYQGEELGLPQAEVPFESLQDPEAIANWPRTLGRDGARTPIPWLSTATNVGFGAGTPWLPIDPRHVELARDQQVGDPQSPLNFTKALTTLRRSYPALRTGNLDFHEAEDPVLAFTRDDTKRPSHSVTCVYNLSHEPTQWAHPTLAPLTIIAATEQGRVGTSPSQHLGPYEAYWAIAKPE